MSDLSSILFSEDNANNISNLGKGKKAEMVARSTVAAKLLVKHLLEPIKKEK